MVEGMELIHKWSWDELSMFQGQWKQGHIIIRIYLFIFKYGFWLMESNDHRGLSQSIHD